MMGVEWTLGLGRRRLLAVGRTKAQKMVKLLHFLLQSVTSDCFQATWSVIRDGTWSEFVPSTKRNLVDVAVWPAAAYIGRAGIQNLMT